MGILALAERPGDTDAEVRGQKPADTKVEIYRSAGKTGSKRSSLESKSRGTRS